MIASAAQEKGYDRIDKHPKSSRYGRQNPISEQWNSDEQLHIWRHIGQIQSMKCLPVIG